jgi:hypothetical protein
MQWDTVAFVIEGNTAGLTGQGAVSSTVPIRRPYIARAFDIAPDGGEPRPSDVIYERRKDAPVGSLKSNSAALPGTIGHFSCQNIVRAGIGDRGNEECGGFCYWGTYRCQQCHMSVVYHYEMLGITVRPGGEDYDAPLTFDEHLARDAAAKRATNLRQRAEKAADLVPFRAPIEGDLAVAPGAVSGSVIEGDLAVAPGALIGSIFREAQQVINQAAVVSAASGARPAPSVAPSVAASIASTALVITGRGVGGKLQQHDARCRKIKCGSACVINPMQMRSVPLDE